jgi:hypothetical protein
MAFAMRNSLLPQAGAQLSSGAAERSLLSGGERSALKEKNPYEAACVRRRTHSVHQCCKSGLERSDIMKWTFIIETSAIMGVKVGIA